MRFVQTPALAALALLCTVSSVAVAAPLSFSHQGRLFDATGNPLTGTHTVDFTLHDAPSGGATLWTESHDVDFDNGYYHVVLGSITPLDPAHFGGDEVFLGMTLAGAPQLTRTQLHSVPWALQADTATHVDGGIVNASEVRINGQTVIDSTGVPDVSWSDIHGIPADFADGTDDGLVPPSSCTDQQTLVFRGGAWTCELNSAHEHDAADITTGTIDMARLAVGTSVDTIARGQHSHSFNDVTGQVSEAQLPANIADLSRQWVDAPGLVSTHSSDAAAHHTRFTNQEAIDAVNAPGLVSTHSSDAAAHHTRFTNQEAIDAVNAPGLVSTHSSNAAAHHTRFTNQEAIDAVNAPGLVSTHSSDAAAHHARFTNQEAIDAVNAAALIAAHTADVSAHHVDADTLASLNCSNGDRIRKVGGSWTCEAAPIVYAGVGLSGSVVDISAAGFTTPPHIVTTASNLNSYAEQVSATDFIPRASTSAEPSFWGIQQGQIFHYDFSGRVLIQFGEPSGSAIHSGITFDTSTNSIWILRQSPGGLMTNMSVSGVVGSSVSVPSDMDDMITYDPSDDTFWLTGYSADVVKINRAGSVLKRFTVGTNLRGVDVDPFDKSIWLMDESANVVRHIDRDTGAVIDGPYSMSYTGGACLVGISRDVDSTFWIADQCTLKYHHVSSTLDAILQTINATNNSNPLGVDIQRTDSSVTGEPVTFIAVGQ